jgi:hypothetical protein
MHPTRHSRDYFQREAVTANVILAIIFAALVAQWLQAGKYILAGLAAIATAWAAWDAYRLRRL